MNKKLKEVKNIFLDLDNFNCYGCSPHHSHGFQLKFFYDEQEKIIQSPLKNISNDKSGFPGVLHGGFGALLLDEIMFWCIFQFCQKISVTAGMDIKFIKTQKTNQPALLKSRVIKSIQDKIFKVEGWIEQDKEVVTKATGKYVVPPKKDFMVNVGAEKLPEYFDSFFHS